MARMPSMVALLGLLAVAGYQNRDKIAGALEGMKDRSANPDGTPRSGLDGVLGGLGDLLGGRDGGTNGGLAGGLGELMESFKRSGQADVADSWINPDVPTKGLTPSQVEQAVGVDNLDELSQRLGLSRDELLARLSTAIPENIDKLTPGGAFPDEQRTRDYFNWPSGQRS